MHMLHDFQSAWARFHPGQPPIGFRLRENGVGHWVRFHSLPGSKRYAETEQERQIVLDRANALAEAVFGPGGLCFLAQARATWDNPDLIDVSHPEAYAACTDFRLQHALSFRDDADEEDVEDATEWQIYAGLFDWQSGRFDRLLTSIAHDEAALTVWMSAADGAVFAPYDGGTDLFLPSAERVHELKAKFEGWLSPHPRGL